MGYIDTLRIFYKQLHDNILTEEKKPLKNSSVFWTLICITDKKREKIINQSSINKKMLPSVDYFELLNLGYIKKHDNPAKYSDYILTAKGLWTIEKEINNFTDDTLIEFIQAKDFDFKCKTEPLDDKDKMALFSLICCRCFSQEYCMYLSNDLVSNNWSEIFSKSFEFLNDRNILKKKYQNYEQLIEKKGTEHPIQYLMRRRNDLSIKSDHIFQNSGKKKYFLDILEDKVIIKDKLKLIFKLIFNSINSYKLFEDIIEFSSNIAYNKVKEVLDEFDLVTSDYDDQIKKSLELFYLEKSE